MFDLTTIAVSDTAAVSLKGPSGKPLADAKGKAVTVTLHSPSSDACVAADDARTERMIERRERKGDVRMTGAELRAEQAQYLADRTASIDNLAYPPAGDASGPALFKAIYSDRRYGFIPPQLNVKLDDWEVFTEGSTTA